MRLPSHQQCTQHDVRAGSSDAQNEGTPGDELPLLLLSAFHQALNERDIGRALRICTQDVSYRSNITRGNGGVVAFEGLRAAECVLARILSSFECLAVVDQFFLSGNKARARFSYVIRHRETGFELAGSCREIVKYDGPHIAAIEIYADAPRVAAYYKLASSQQGLTLSKRAPQVASFTS